MAQIDTDSSRRKSASAADTSAWLSSYAYEMKKKDVRRNLLVGWALVGIALLFLLASLTYALAIQNWIVQGVLNP
jgi:hypothetical protein